jgi:hypothetical protein
MITKTQKTISLAITAGLIIFTQNSCASLTSIPLNFKDRTWWLHPNKPALFYNYYSEYKCGFLKLAHCYQMHTDEIDLTIQENRKRLIDAGFTMRVQNEN